MKRLKLAGIGCGNRTTTYMNLAAKMPDKYEIVGAADPIEWKVRRIAEMSGCRDFRVFESADDLLAEDKFADVLIIGTQDSYHVEPCIAAMEKGYDLLLEKPIATTAADMLRLERVAKALGRRVLVCHVLRYSPFYRAIKQIVDSGELGDIVTLNATEGVGTFHQAHSFVRGHWSVTERSSPMIIQKSCHDLDVIQWIMDRPFERVSSFGGINYFSIANKPVGAPKYCVQGCPVGESCQYNAERYLKDQRRWLPYVYSSAITASDDDVLQWLKTCPWGRCVYQCDNTAVDHQTVNIEFAGNATATFTMSAFDSGRNIEIWGTKAVLRGGTYTRQTTAHDISIRNHATDKTRVIQLPEPSHRDAGHDGGDWGLIDSLFDEMQTSDPENMRSSLKVSVQGHLMGFAAEHARLTASVVENRELNNRRLQGRGASRHSPDSTAATLSI